MKVDPDSSSSWHNQHVHVRGTDLFVRSRGEGPALIWGHGLLTSMAQEDEVGVFDWSRTGLPMRWVRYDARGHGASGATYDPSGYQWPALAQDLLALATALGEREAVFGGVSMGCATSLHAAVAAPERVRALLLVAPPTAWKTRPRQSRIYHVCSLVVGSIGLGPVRLIGRLPSFGKEDSVVARMQRALVDHLAAADERAVKAALDGAALSDLPEPQVLALLDVPALILAWRGDPVHPVSSAERLAELLPRAELSVAAGLRDFRDWPAKVRTFLGRQVLQSAQHEPAAQAGGD